MQFESLAIDQFASVREMFQAEAQDALANMPVARISAEEAVRLSGRRLRLGGEYVLLRSLVLNEANGSFEIGVSGGAVHVRHGSLGARHFPMRRKAVVAVLPSVPDTVYVSCSMAR